MFHPPEGTCLKDAALTIFDKCIAFESDSLSDWFREESQHSNIIILNDEV